MPDAPAARDSRQTISGRTHSWLFGFCSLPGFHFPSLRNLLGRLHSTFLAPTRPCGWCEALPLARVILLLLHYKDVEDHCELRAAG